MTRKDIESAIASEVESWPDVTVQFVEGRKHPRAKFAFGGNMLSVTYASTPSDVRTIKNCISECRNVMTRLGAERDSHEPKDVEPKEYRPANEGKAKRSDPVQSEPAKPEPTIKEKLESLPEGSLPQTVEETVAAIDGPLEIEDVISWTRFDPETGEQINGTGPIDQPGLYRMDDETYHGDPCAEPSLSASLLKKAMPGGKKGGSPRHMQYAHPKLTPVELEPSSKKFDVGSVFHTLILGEGDEIVIVESDAWRTKAAKQERDEALEAGQQPILRDQYDRAAAMVRAAHYQIPIWPELEKAMADGQAEYVLIWKEQTRFGEIFCRCKLDWIPAQGGLFPDWKTTDASAGPDDYGRTMFDIGADIQDSFYRRGIKAILKRDARIIFPVIEAFEPHCMMVHAIDNADEQIARRKVEWGMNVYAACLAQGVWPGYPGHIAYQAAPPWISRQWEDREDSGLDDPQFTVKLIEKMKDMAKSGAVLPAADKEFADDFGLESETE